MPSTSNPSPSITIVSPLAWIGRAVLGALAYLGALAVLLGSAVDGARNVGVTSRTFRAMVLDDLAWMFAMGLPLVALVHVGMGSFLCMQSYFGGTFVDGAGAVVGVGLIRNLAPMMACYTLAGIMAAYVTPDLRARAHPAEPGEPHSFQRLVAARLVAAGMAGPVFSIWGAAVGTLVGWQVGQTLMGVSTHSFLIMFREMLWMRDVVGLVVKGAGFALVATLFACHEGLWRTDTDGESATPITAAACRAACLSWLAILVLNSGWFILVYHAGPAFGPTLLAPPAS